MTLFNKAIIYLDWQCIWVGLTRSWLCWSNIICSFGFVVFAKVIQIEGKGRGVVATFPFTKGDFIVEYAGDLVNYTTAKKREVTYSADQRLGCYMYYFVHKDKHYWWVDYSYFFILDYGGKLAMPRRLVFACLWGDSTKFDVPLYD